jgi:hypothetical protein
MAAYFNDSINPILDNINKDLKCVGLSIKVRHKHVLDRLIDRNISHTFFAEALQIMTDNICQLIYYTSLDKPFYSFSVRTEHIILAIGFQSGDKSKFVIRTILDPRIHNKHADEISSIIEIKG